MNVFPMKKSKVLFFHPSNDYTGSTRVLANIIRQDYIGEEVIVITNKGEGFLSELNNVKIKNTWQPYRKGQPIRCVSYIIWFIVSLYLSIRYGFFHSIFYINTTQPVYAAIAGTILNKKIIYHVHEVFPKNSLTAVFLRFVFEKTTAHRIYVSNYTKTQYKDNLKCTWEIKYNKLSPDFVSRITFLPYEKRKRNTVLMLSCLDRKKGLFTFIDVARLVPECTFLLVISKDMQSIEAFFQKAGPLPGNVKIYPSQSNIHPLMKNADLMLNLSIPDLCVETFGMTILEAMAYGIPSIVPNVGGPTELITDGYNGYCLDVTDKKVVADAIRKSLNKDHYLMLAEHSLEAYRTKFS